MDIFKLFFDHDLRLDKLAKRNANKTEEERGDEKEASLEDFMQPDPTYSKFYLTGTRLEEEKFGINTLHKWDAVSDKIDRAFEDHYFHSGGTTYTTAAEAIAAGDIGSAIVLTDEPGEDPETTAIVATLQVDHESNVGHIKEELSNVLRKGHLVLYKEQAHNGFDLHLFSKENIYPLLFHAFKPLVESDFRFFSINSKRMGSERHFYFETWTLEKPPHGAEEVHPQTVL